jgi:hypothetical protein
VVGVGSLSVLGHVFSSSLPFPLLAACFACAEASSQVLQEEAHCSLSIRLWDALGKRKVELA